MSALIKAGNPAVISISGVQYPISYKTGLKILVSRVTGAGSYSPFRELGVATDYSVPAAKSFKALGVKIYENIGTQARIGVGYAATAGTWAGGAAPTTPLFSIGHTATARYNLSCPASSNGEAFLFGWSVPTGKFPFAYSDPAGNDATVYLIGYEE